MKRKLFIIILLFLGIGIIYIFSSKTNNPKEKITLGEVTHSIFYTPLYVAIENDYFEEENIDLNLVLTSGADKVSAAVLSGDVEIGFAGAESAIYIYQNNPKDYVQIFCGLTKRDGQFIVSKKQIDNFSLEDLYGKEILVGRNSGMPALNFLNALKKNNIDSKKININYNVEFAALSGAYISSKSEFVNLFEPNALTLENENLGFVVASIGELSGEMPYTTFYAKKSFINNNPNIIKGFTRAINKGLDFVNNNSDETIAKTIQNQFPDTSIKNLTKLVHRYKINDSWLNNGYISEKLLQNLEDIMIDNNLLESYVPYKDLIIYQK